MDSDVVRELTAVGSAVGGAIIVHAIAIWILLNAVPETALDGAARILVRRCRWPSLVVAVTAAALIALVTSGNGGSDERAIVHALVLALIAGVAWLLVRVLAVGADLLAKRFDVDAGPDNLRARRVQTQALIFRRIAAVVIWVVAAAVMLTTFSEVRALGASMLASAGIAGIVLGFAAQQTLGNLIAGIQIALTEPLRLDDVVIVEGEYGRIEEITFTYVVVGIWDERRLVLPISYFTTTPFENWTRTDSEITGTVFLYVDHTAPLDEMRAELRRVAAASELWDGRNVELIVTDTNATTIEVRLLVTARSAPELWDLRCVVREALITFLQREHPHALPRVRAEVERRG